MRGSVPRPRRLELGTGPEVLRSEEHGTALGAQPCLPGAFVCILPDHPLESQRPISPKVPAEFKAINDPTP